MAAVVAAIGVSVAAGVALERRSRLDAQRLAALLVRVMLWTALPFVVFFAMASLEVDAGVGLGILAAYVGLGLVGVAAHLVGTRVLRLPRPSVGALVLVVIMANSGYLGIPLNATLLGHDAIAPAIAFDTLVAGPMFLIVAFAVGAAFGDRVAGSRAERVRGMLLNPPLLAAVAGLAAGQLTGGAIAPDALVDAANLVVYALLPCGFLLVGIALAAEAEEGALAFPPRFDGAVATAMALRLVAAPAVLLAASAIIVDVPDAYLVQAAMPSGINSLVVAHAFGLDVRLCAAAITWTTLAVIVVGLVAGVA